MAKVVDLTRDERIAWMETLQIGDKVCMRTYGWRSSGWVVGKVLHITPTGRLKLQLGNIEYYANPDGTLRGTNGSIRPLSEDVLADIKEIKLRRHTKSLIHRVSRLDVENMPVEDVQKLYDSLKPFEEEENA